MAVVKECNKTANDVNDKCRETAGKLKGKSKPSIDPWQRIGRPPSDRLKILYIVVARLCKHNIYCFFLFFSLAF